MAAKFKKRLTSVRKSMNHKRTRKLRKESPRANLRDGFVSFVVVGFAELSRIAKRVNSRIRNLQSFLYACIQPAVVKACQCNS